MKLYVCYGTFGAKGHPCGKAHAALAEAGHAPEVEKVFGGLGTDPFFPGRRRIKEMTGSSKVPTLVLDDGTVVDGSDQIVKWAESHPAAG
jgi:glutathione S-transferase